MVDTAEFIRLDAPLLVLAGRIGYVCRRAADAQAVEVREDYQMNARRLADVWPESRKRYDYLVRDVVLGGLVLAPQEELIIGRATGLEVHKADGTLDSIRSGMHFDQALQLAFALDKRMSDRHVAITALPGGNVNVMDLGSTNGTSIQILR